MPKVWNKHHKNAPPDAVYVGRPSKWGNPFSHQNGTAAKFKVDTREEAVEEFHYYILDILEEHPYYLAELKGKDLICWCAPKPCHADILLELANS